MFLNVRESDLAWGRFWNVFGRKIRGWNSIADETPLVTVV